MILRALPGLLVLSFLSSYAGGQPARSEPQIASVSSSVGDVQTLPNAPKPATTRPSFSDLHIPDWVTHSRNYPPEAAEWASVIDPGQRVTTLTVPRKLYYAGREQLAPVIFLPAIVSASYEHVADANPQYGSDGNGYAERFGAAMLRQAIDRLSGDGLFPALLRQDPRYYRAAEGSIVHRGVNSAVQALMRRGDNGHKQGNWSGLFAHALSNGLAVTYYPEVSATGRVAAQGFATSVAADAGSKLLQEFLPDFYYLAFQRKH
jgi:hypothetical protein